MSDLDEISRVAVALSGEWTSVTEVAKFCRIRYRPTRKLLDLLVKLGVADVGEGHHRPGKAPVKFLYRRGSGEIKSSKWTAGPRKPRKPRWGRDLGITHWATWDPGVTTNTCHGNFLRVTGNPDRVTCKMCNGQKVSDSWAECKRNVKWLDSVYLVTALSLYAVSFRRLK